MSAVGSLGLQWDMIGEDADTFIQRFSRAMIVSISSPFTKVIMIFAKFPDRQTHFDLSNTFGPHRVGRTLPY